MFLIDTTMTSYSAVSGKSLNARELVSFKVSFDCGHHEADINMGKAQGITEGAGSQFLSLFLGL